MEQLILHLLGDFVIQNDWMANNKTRRSWPAFCHVVVYGIPFLLIGSWPAVAVICLTHFLIDRFRLVRYLVWTKNWASPVRYPWAECRVTGFHKSTPDWLATWLMIIADATLHLIRPLGFSLDDPRFKRAGLDYWDSVDMWVHPHWRAFRDAVSRERCLYFSTHGTRSRWRW